MWQYQLFSNTNIQAQVLTLWSHWTLNTDEKIKQREENNYLDWISHIVLHITFGKSLKWHSKTLQTLIKLLCILLYSVSYCVSYVNILCVVNILLIIVPKMIPEFCYWFLKCTHFCVLSQSSCPSSAKSGFIEVHIWSNNK